VRIAEERHRFYRRKGVVADVPALNRCTLVLDATPDGAAAVLENIPVAILQTALPRVPVASAAGAARVRVLRGPLRASVGCLLGRAPQQADGDFVRLRVDSGPREGCVVEVAADDVAELVSEEAM
jgi:hypothetical protein